MNAVSDFRLNEIGINDPPDLSVVVPVFNEREVLPMLHSRLKGVLENLSVNYEVVLVDDGSQDGSGEYLVKLASTTPRVKSIRLSRNFGKEAALSAGLDQATGNAIVVMDADLQDPPELIPKMYQTYLQGFDVVCMKRLSRDGESFLKRTCAYLFYRLLNRISRVKIPEDTGDFRLISRRAVDALNRIPERNRYMKGLFAWIGLPTKVIEYKRASRAAGITKWDFLSLFGLAIEGITSFSVAPLRWATTIGLFAALVGIAFGVWIVIKTIVLGNVVEGYPSLIAIITFLGGVQLFSVGLLGEYVGKTYVEAKQRPLYIIQDIVQVRSQQLDSSLTQEPRQLADSN